MCAENLQLITEIGNKLIEATSSYKYPVLNSWFQRLIDAYKKCSNKPIIHLVDLPNNTSVEFSTGAISILKNYIKGKTKNFPHYFLARYVWGMRRRLLLETLKKIISTKDLLELEKYVVTIKIWPGKVVRTKFPVKLDDDIAWAQMMGFAFDMYISDAIFTNVDEGLLKVFAGAWHEISGCEVLISKPVSGNIKRIHTSKFVKHVFISAGFIPLDMPQILVEPRVPHWVFKTFEKWRIELLRCMFDSEGDVNVSPLHKGIRLTQAKLLSNKKLIKREMPFGSLPSNVKEAIVKEGPPLSLLSVSLLLLQQGIMSYIYPSLAKPNRYGTLCAWKLEVRGKKNLIGFKEKIKFFNSEKKNKKLQKIWDWAKE